MARRRFSMAVSRSHCVEANPTEALSPDQKSITALSSKLADQPTFYSGSYDGKVNKFDFSHENGDCTPVSGSGHSNSVIAIANSDRGSTYSAGMDDTVKEITSDSTYTYVCMLSM